MSQQNQQERSQQLRIDYQQVFNTDSGKRVLEDILSYCHVLEPLLGSIDTNSIIIREARRDVAITILQKLNWNEKDFMEMIGGQE
jgi:hypothetical protein